MSYFATAGRCVTAALQGVHDPVRRAKLLWAGVAAVLAAVFACLGLAFLLGGIRVTADSRSFQAVQEFLPGGMRTQGLLMVVLGSGLGFGLLAPLYGRALMVRLTHRWLILATGYWLWLVIEFLWSWWLNGRLAFLGIVVCAAFAILSGLLVKLPPVPRASDGSSGRV